MGLSLRMPLRVALSCLAVSLAAAGAVVIGIAGVSAARGYLVRQADDTVRACASGMLSQGLVAAPAPGPPPPEGCEAELLSARGQVLTVAVAGTSWLAAQPAWPVTVPGTRGGGRWRLVIETVHYRPQRILYVYGPDDVRYVVAGRAGHGSSGIFVVMAEIAGTERVAAGYAAAAGAVLVLLAAAALAWTRVILQPLRAAADLADSAAQAMVARAGGEQNNWPLGMTVTVTERDRRSAAEMSQPLVEACLEVRRSISVVHGFAQYWRQRGRSTPSGADQMLRRVADEVAQMETLVEGLRTLTAASWPVVRAGQRR